MTCAICGKPAVRPYRVACGPEHSKEHARLKRNATQRRWRSRNLTWHKEYMREWRSDNPEKVRQSWKRYYASKRSAINAKMRAKRATRPLDLVAS